MRFTIFMNLNEHLFIFFIWKYHYFLRFSSKISQKHSMNSDEHEEQWKMIFLFGLCQLSLSNLSWLWSPLSSTVMHHTNCLWVLSSHFLALLSNAQGHRMSFLFHWTQILCAVALGSVTLGLTLSHSVENILSASWPRRAFVELQSVSSVETWICEVS